MIPLLFTFPVPVEAAFYWRAILAVVVGIAILLFAVVIVALSMTSRRRRRVQLRRQHRRSPRQTIARGRCAACGYDLRATRSTAAAPLPGRGIRPS